MPPKIRAVKKNNNTDVNRVAQLSTGSSLNVHLPAEPKTGDAKIQQDKNLVETSTVLGREKLFGTDIPGRNAQIILSQVRSKAPDKKKEKPTDEVFTEYLHLLEKYKADATKLEEKQDATGDSAQDKRKTVLLKGNINRNETNIKNLQKIVDEELDDTNGNDTN